LPSSSGSLSLSRTTVARKDTEFVRQHAARIEAQIAQSDAMTALVESRARLALAMARLSVLPEIAEHEYRIGRREREHEHRLLEIKCLTAEAEAQVILAKARSRLTQFEPPAMPPRPEAEPSQPPQPAALSADEIEELLQALPEIAPETLHTISLLVKGRLKEKG
jgi:hypothetical protein